MIDERQIQSKVFPFLEIISRLKLDMNIELFNSLVAYKVFCKLFQTAQKLYIVI